MNEEQKHETYPNEEFNKLVGVLLDRDGRDRVAYFTDGIHSEWVARRSVSTGRLITRKMGVGRSIYTAEVPEMVTHEPMSAATLKELAYGLASERLESLNKNPYVYEDNSPSIGDRDTEFLTALQVRFEKELSEYLAKDHPEIDTVECHRCQGKGKTINSCWDCTQGVQDVHIGMVANDDDLIIDTPNPAHQVKYEVLDCELCHGTKKYEVPCYECNSTGQVSRTITITIIGDNGIETITTDITELIKNNDAKLVISRISRSINASISVVLDLSPLRERLARTLVGENKKTLFITAGKNIRRPDDYFRSIHVDTTNFVYLDKDQYGEVHWKPTGEADYVEPYYVPITFEDAYRKLAGWEISDMWESLQKKFTSQYTYIWQPSDTGLTRKEYLESVLYTLDANEVINGTTVTVIEEKENIVLLQELAELAAQKGYGVELSYGFIATEETGPEIILTTRSGIGYAALGLEYTWTVALTSALLLLEKKIDEIPPAEVVEDWYRKKQEDQ